MKLRYTPAAILDLQEIESYIRDILQNPEAAAHVLSSLTADCARLKEQPRLGPELSKKLGREVEGRYLIRGKYMVIYEYADIVSILRVLDTRTDTIRILFR